jgi:hypothetical protein
MPPAVNVGPSRSRLTRAQQHLDSFEEAMERLHQVSDPYALSFDPRPTADGWLTVYATARDIEDVGLSLVLSDLINNLRSALDYLVTALVEASEAQLANAHAFPIYDSLERYEKEIAKAGVPLAKGKLQGLKVGADVILKHQPFNRPADSSWSQDPLIALQRLSNSDKHRGLSTQIVAVGRTDQYVGFGGTDVNVLEVRYPKTPPRLSAGEKSALIAIRLAEPYPSDLRVYCDLKMHALIGVRPFPPKEPEGFLLHQEAISDIFDRVAEVVNDIEGIQ